MYAITLDNIHASKATGTFVDIPREPVPEGGVECIIPVGAQMHIERISRCRSLMTLAFDRKCLNGVGSSFWIPRRLLQEMSEPDDEWFEIVHSGANDVNLVYPGKSVSDGVLLWGHIHCTFKRVKKVTFPPFPDYPAINEAKPPIVVIDADKARELRFFNSIVNGCCPRGKPCKYHQ